MDPLLPQSSNGQEWQGDGVIICGQLVPNTELALMAGMASICHQGNCNWHRARRFRNRAGSHRECAGRLSRCAVVLLQWL
ncbi:MAG: hypothetical protein Ct9H300mP7_5140 [Verrucomicrobiota bacterium]|nr:MAG: hypothetical protein Ct9H300mP7_5140 [Verrucomicrobiota bacterium]